MWFRLLLQWFLYPVSDVSAALISVGQAVPVEGRYTIEGLRSGMYHAAVLRSGVPVMLYGDRPCPENECDPTTGVPILVEGDALTKRVNIHLGK